jgi:hypothetical protein
MTQQATSSSSPIDVLLLHVLPWALGLAAGAAFLVLPSALATASTAALAAAVVVAWYVLETARWLLAALRPPNRAVALVYVVPRLACTPACLAAAYLLGLPVPQIVLASFLATLLLETLVRLALRILARPLFQAARERLTYPHADPGKRAGAVRMALAALTALLFALCFSFTAYVYLTRETLFDARVWIQKLHPSGLYDAGLRYASATAQATARQQRGDARQIADLLTDDDLRLAEQWALPTPWTTAWLYESLDATLHWMLTTGDQRVPPISVPVADIERHAKDAASLLIDQYAETLPLCTPDTPARQYCRPPEMSVDAYRATYKPQDMAVADEILEIVPDELDLSTAVALFGEPFQKPLAELNRARSAVQELEKRLPLAAVLSLGLLALLWLLSGTRLRHMRLWIGGALLLTALLVWATSYAAYSQLPQRLVPLDSRTLPAHLSVPLHDFMRAMLNTAHNRALLFALVLAGLGLLLLWLPLLAPHKEFWTRRRPLYPVLRAGVLVLVLANVLWITYGRVGARLYAQANRAHRAGDVDKANAGYQQIVRLYPFRFPGPGGGFVARARSDQYECQLYLDAETAYLAADWQAAVQHYEALWLTQPALQLRDAAEPRLLEALMSWARELEAAGQRERALDRYRFVRDQQLGRGKQIDGQPVRIHRVIGDLYLEWGDELLNRQDYQAARATYRRALAETDDPGTWDRAEERLGETYCAWATQLRLDGQVDRAEGICVEFENELPALAPDPCASCPP